MIRAVTFLAVAASFFLFFPLQPSLQGRLGLRKLSDPVDPPRTSDDFYRSVQQFEKLKMELSSEVQQCEVLQIKNFRSQLTSGWRFLFDTVLNCTDRVGRTCALEVLVPWQEKERLENSTCSITSPRGRA